VSEEVHPEQPVDAFMIEVELVRMPGADLPSCQRLWFALHELFGSIHASIFLPRVAVSSFLASSSVIHGDEDGIIGAHGQSLRRTRLVGRGRTSARYSCGSTPASRREPRIE
jgi:hypothetical protein